MLGISDAAISFEEPRDSVLSSKYLGEKELKVLSCPAGHQSVGAMTIRELLSGRLAVPINLSPCLNAINQCPEAQLVNFRFRDVEYGSRAQAEFLQAGGLILSLSGSSLASDGSEVSAPLKPRMTWPCPSIFAIDKMPGPIDTRRFFCTYCVILLREINWLRDVK